jgi:DNA-binding NtrC family response regulator
LCQSHPSKVDLVLMDIVIPGGMNGRQLAEQMITIRPEMRVLLMSGYTPDELADHGVKKGAPFSQKPYTMQQLALKVREVLDSSADPIY